ncbi:MAG: ABC transporter transmembrane domain-containing protein [Caldilineaceae bacterium]
MTGIGLVKAYAREPHELHKFDEANEEWFTQRYDSIKLWALFWPLFSLVLAVAIFILLWFGGPPALRGETLSRFTFCHDLLCLDAQRPGPPYWFSGQYGNKRQRQCHAHL